MKRCDTREKSFLVQSSSNSFIVRFFNSVFQTETSVKNTRAAKWNLDHHCWFKLSPAAIWLASSAEFPTL